MCVFAAILDIDEKIETVLLGGGDIESQPLKTTLEQFNRHREYLVSCENNEIVMETKKRKLELTKKIINKELELQKSSEESKDGLEAELKLFKMEEEILFGGSYRSFHFSDLRTDWHLNYRHPHQEQILLRRFVSRLKSAVCAKMLAISQISWWNV